eukprot:3514220-Amphidinium_carterae.2
MGQGWQHLTLYSRSTGCLHKLHGGQKLTIRHSRDARNCADMHVASYADADLSGDSTRAAKSTTVSTAEAELVPMTSAKESAIPVQVLLAVAFGKLRMYEDNDACSSVVKSGYSPRLRHLVRTQRTSIGMLSEVLLPHEIGTAEFQVELNIMNIRAPDGDDKDSAKCLSGLERFEDAIPPPTARGSDDPMPIEGPITPPPPPPPNPPPPPTMEGDDIDSEEVDTTFDRTLNDASSFAHFHKHPLCRQCVMFKAKASPTRLRSLGSFHFSEQASITEAFQGLQLDNKYMLNDVWPIDTLPHS